jgi:hypothetical protein
MTTTLSGCGQSSSGSNGQARNVQVLPAGCPGLQALGPRFDAVFVDAPLHGLRGLAAAAGRQVALEARQSRAATG